MALPVGRRAKEHSSWPLPSSAFCFYLFSPFFWLHSLPRPMRRSGRTPAISPTARPTLFKFRLTGTAPYSSIATATCLRGAPIPHETWVIRPQACSCFRAVSHSPDHPTRTLDGPYRKLCLIKLLSSIFSNGTLERRAAPSPGAILSAGSSPRALSSAIRTVLTPPCRCAESSPVASPLGTRRSIQPSLSRPCSHQAAA